MHFNCYGLPSSNIMKTTKPVPAVYLFCPNDNRTAHLKTAKPNDLYCLIL